MLTLADHIALATKHCLGCLYWRCYSLEWISIPSNADMSCAHAFHEKYCVIPTHFQPWTPLFPDTRDVSKLHNVNGIMI